MEDIRNKIENKVSAVTKSGIKWYNVLGKSDMVRKETVAIESLDDKGNEVTSNLKAEIWTAAIQSAIKQHKNVYIPNMGHEIYIDQPIVLSSNCNLKIDENQIVVLMPRTNTCMVRNENIVDGYNGVPHAIQCDENISIEGGIWTTCANGSKNANGNISGYTDSSQSIKGSMGVIILHHVENVTVRNLTIKESVSFGVQIGDCTNFIIENINFVKQKKDGIHLNGPSEYGVIRGLQGKDMGDDMVALNAWDWCTSAITFGPIRNVIVEKIESDNNEIRVLPGRKVFSDGKYVDCDITECIFEDIKGIYTFKLYCQPNIANVTKGINDVSGTVGTIKQLYFNNIEFGRIRSNGLNGLPVRGFFEICADCENLYFDNISIDCQEKELIDNNITLISVGPLSATWKNNSNDPKCWGEVFSPNAICEVNKVYIKNVQFKSEKKQYNIAKNLDLLAKEIHLSINNDYPKSTPKGGNGYGILKNIFVN